MSEPNVISRPVSHEAVHGTFAQDKTAPAPDPTAQAVRQQLKQSPFATSPGAMLPSVRSEPQALKSAERQATLPEPILALQRDCSRLTSTDAREQLSLLYAQGSYHEALDASASADIIRQTLLPQARIDQLTQGLKQGADETFALMVEAQIQCLLDASTPETIQQALRQLESTRRLMNEAGVLPEDAKALFAELEAIGAHKTTRATALAAQEQALSQAEQGGASQLARFTLRLPPRSTTGDASLLAQQAGQQILERQEQALHERLETLQQPVTATYARLAELDGTQTGLRLDQVLRAAGEHALARQACLEYSQAQRTSLTTQLEALQPGSDPDALRQRLQHIEARAQRRLTAEDRLALQPAFTTAQNRANAHYRATLLPDHAVVKPLADQKPAHLDALGQLLEPAGYASGLLARLEGAEPAQLAAALDAWTAARTPSANADSRALACTHIDRLLMDDPRLHAEALAIKDSLIPEGQADERATMHRRHASVAANAELLALLHTLGADHTQSVSAVDLGLDTLQAWVEQLGTQRPEAHALASQDLLLLNAYWQAYGVERPELDGKPIAQAPETFLHTLPQTYRQSLASVASGLTSSRHVQSAQQILDNTSDALNNPFARGAFRQQDPEAERHQANAARNALVATLLGLNQAQDITQDHAQCHRLIATHLAQTLASAQHEVKEGSLEAALATLQATEQDRLQPLAQTLAEAQGAKKLTDIKGETLAVSVLLLQRLLTTEVGQLSEHELTSLGLTADNSRHPAAQLAVIRQTDWSQANTWPQALLLQTYCDRTGVSPDTLAHPNFMASATWKDTQALLALTPEARRAAVAELAIVQENIHLRLESMTTNTGPTLGMTSRESDDAGRAFRDACRAYAGGYVGFGPQILETINTQNLTAKADVVLTFKDHGTKTVSEAIERALEKAAAKLGEPNPLEQVSRTLTRDKLHLVNLASQHLRARDQALFDLGKAQLRFADQTLSLTGKFSAQTATLALAYLACLEVFETSTLTKLEDFSARLKTQLSAANQDLGQTPIYQDTVKNLTEMGMRTDQAQRVALLFYTAAGTTSLHETLKLGFTASEALSLYKNTLGVARNTPEPVRQALNAFALQDSCTRILAALEPGQLLSVVDTSAVKLIATDPNMALSVAVGLGREAGLLLYRDADNTPRIYLNREHFGSLGVGLGWSGLAALGVEVAAKAGEGLTLSFGQDSDCAAFVGRLMSGQADASDLLACRNIALVETTGGQVSVGASLDVGEALGVSGLELGASAQASGSLDYRVEFSGEGKKTSRTMTATLGVAVNGTPDFSALAGLFGGNAPPPTPDEQQQETRETNQKNAQQLLTDTGKITEANRTTSHELNREFTEVSASTTLNITHDNWVRSSHSGATIKAAGFSQAMSFSDRATAHNFCVAIGIGEPTRGELLNLAKKSQGPFTITCHSELPANLLQGRTREQTQALVDDRANYQMNQVSLRIDGAASQTGGSGSLLGVGVTKQAIGKSATQYDFDLSLQPSLGR